MTGPTSLTTPFVAIALCVGAVAALGVEPPLGVQVVGLAIVVGLVGLPHGALDPVVARDAGIVGGTASIGAYLVGYVGLAATTAALWWAVPSIVLPAFFVVSALHFGGDWPGMPAVTRALAGAAVVSLPIAFHPTAATSLLDPLADSATVDRLVATATVLGPTAAGAVVLLAVVRHRASRAAVEIGAIIGLAWVAPPLIAFGTYFCALHSPRHMAGVVRRSSAGAGAAVATAAVFTFATLLGAALAWPFLSSTASPDDAAVRLIFIGLAALTVPHMATIERARRRPALVSATPIRPRSNLDPRSIALIHPNRKDLR